MNPKRLRPFQQRPFPRRIEVNLTVTDLAATSRLIHDLMHLTSSAPGRASDRLASLLTSMNEISHSLLVGLLQLNRGGKTTYILDNLAARIAKLALETSGSGPIRQDHPGPKVVIRAVVGGTG